MKPQLAAVRHHLTSTMTANPVNAHLSVALLMAAALLLCARKSDAQEAVSLKAAQWTPATLFPPGALLTVLSGDPAQPGQSIAALSLPDGYRVPPHFNPMGEGLEVREGTLLVGMGEHFDVRKADTLRTGDTVFMPAGVRHYWVARGPTVVALTFDGPYTITYVNAYEAPRRTTFPYQH